MTLFHLFCTFFYIGLFTIGGGQVAITLMYGPIVDGGLISSEQFYNMVAISESTPGPIGINMATYIGYEMFGVIGGIVVTLGTVLPSLIIITLIARFFAAFHAKSGVQAAFTGLRPATTGMIAVAAAQVFCISILNLPAFRESGSPLAAINLPQAIFFVIALALLLRTKINPILVIVAGAAFGMIFL